MASPSVTHQRRQQALRLLGEGFGATELTAKLSAEWGCSRRQARRYVAAAYGEINRLEQVARLAAESGQHGAVVGACKLLNEIAIAPHRNRTPAHFGRFGRSSRS
jgi:hypothetical protein